MPPATQAILSRDFEQFFGQIVSIRIKALDNTEKKAHFRLMCVAQKRGRLNSLSFCPAGK